MKNRWLIAASAVGIHISIGSVYAWSVVSKPMIAEYGWTLKQVSLTFSIAIFCLGFSAAFLGRFVERYGPRKSGTISAILFGAGLVTAGFGCHCKSLWLLYAGYGVLGGTGIGIGYIAPISALIQWFAEKKGLATGLAIMGFGFASLICGPLMQFIMSHWGIPAVFYCLGAVYFVMISGCSQYLAMPEGYTTVRKDAANFSAATLLTDWRFYFLWSVFFINIACGISLLSVASPMAQEIAGLSPAAATTLVGLIGLFNGMGRIGWSSLSDHIGRPILWGLFFLIQTACFFMLGRVENPIGFAAIIFLIVTCYGGGFASMPAFISDIFGSHRVATILGMVLTAWSAAGIAGPIFTAWMRERCGGYEPIFMIFVGLCAVSLGIMLLFIGTGAKGIGMCKSPVRES
ncbi:MAG: OFA family MFS transporter [Planctomycetes bacterium]|nr:OFA family MFS transporter [Planctomycetota bacterium]